MRVLLNRRQGEPAGSGCQLLPRLHHVSRLDLLLVPPSLLLISSSAPDDSTPRSWTREIQADNGDLVAGHGHAKPGIVAVAPGAFISSQIIALCKKGLEANPDMSCGEDLVLLLLPATVADDCRAGTKGSANYTERKPSDVLNYGMGLLISKDGTHWSLFKKTWPIQGMYTTAAALSVDTEGAALTYGIVFAAGSLPTSKTGTIYL